MMRLRDLTSRASSSFLRRRRSSSSSSRRMTLSFNFIGSDILAGTWVFLLCGMTDKTSTTQLTLLLRHSDRVRIPIYIYRAKPNIISTLLGSIVGSVVLGFKDSELTQLFAR